MKEQEPATYTKLFKALSKSKNNYIEELKEDKIDSHTQIGQASYFARRLENYIKNFFKFSNVKILDCGSGLGYISRELDKVKKFKTYSLDPSKSAKKISNILFPNNIFIHADIKKIPKKYNNFFDVIYLREVYPFTRTSNLRLHIELLAILNRKIKKNGVLIFEQIINEKDLFSNLSKLKLDYEIHSLLPIRLYKFDFLNIMFSKLKIIQILIYLIYKIFNKKKNHFIIIKKVDDL